MKAFLTFKIVNTKIFLNFQKVLTLKLWQNTQLKTAIFFCFMFTAKHGDYNATVRNSEPIKLLESPRSLSVSNLTRYHSY